MGSNPINLALRFLLELAALGALAYWGWTQNEGILRLLLAVGLPLLAAVLWGFFRYPGERANPPVPVPGPVRLLIELLVFGSAVGLLVAANAQTAALIFGGLLILHYLASYDYVLALLRGQKWTTNFGEK